MDLIIGGRRIIAEGSIASRLIRAAVGKEGPASIASKEGQKQKGKLGVIEGSRTLGNGVERSR